MSDIPVYIKYILTFLGGSGIVGLFSAWIVYIGNRPKVTAESKQLDANTIVTFADGWEKLYNEMKGLNEKANSKLDQMTDRYEKMEETCRKSEEAHRLAIEEKNQVIAAKDLIILEKDGIIEAQTKQIADLNTRVTDFGNRLSKYENIEGKAADAKEILHAQVEETINHITE